MGVILDTSYLIDVERKFGHADAIPSLDTVFVSAVTVAEFLLGVELADAARRGRRERFIADLVTRAAILSFDLAAARYYATIATTLRRRGLTIGDRDAMIAAT